MKKLFLIVLFTLTTCATIEESIDDHAILEKNKEKTIASSIKPQTRNIKGAASRNTTRYRAGVTIKDIMRYKTGVNTRYSPKVKTPKNSRKTFEDLNNISIKGNNGLFLGKLEKKFRKQKDSLEIRVNWGIIPGRAYHNRCELLPLKCKFN